jgi:hypothetical protein
VKRYVVPSSPAERQNGIAEAGRHGDGEIPLLGMNGIREFELGGAARALLSSMSAVAAARGDEF